MRYVYRFGAVVAVGLMGASAMAQQALNAPPAQDAPLNDQGGNQNPPGAPQGDIGQQEFNAQEPGGENVDPNGVIPEGNGQNPANPGAPNDPIQGDGGPNSPNANEGGNLPDNVPNNNPNQVNPGGDPGVDINDPNSVPNAGAAPSSSTNYDPYELSRTPWFGSQDVRNRLNLDERQYNRLNRAYQQSWWRYNRQLNALPPTNDPRERLQRRRELSDQYYREFSQRSDELLTDPQMRRRYQELSRQYQGYRVFDDPAVQKQLGLTPQQLRRLQGYSTQWNSQMQDYGQNFQNKRLQTSRQFQEARQREQLRIQATLTPAQRQMWSNLTGQTYEFSPDAYFRIQNATEGPTRVGPTRSNSSGPPVTEPMPAPSDGVSPSEALPPSANPS